MKKKKKEREKRESKKRDRKLTCNKAVEDKGIWKKFFNFSLTVTSVTLLLLHAFTKFDINFESFIVITADFQVGSLLRIIHIAPHILQTSLYLN